MTESNSYQPDLFSLLPDPPQPASAPDPQAADDNDAPQPLSHGEAELSANHLTGLLKLNQSTQKQLAQAFEHLLAGPVDLALLDITRSTHGIIQLFCRQRGPLYIATAQPGSHRLWIHLEAGILHAMLYQLLGQTGDVMAVQRPLSPVESRLVGRMVTGLTQTLQKAYAREAVVVQLQPKVAPVDPAALRGQTPVAHARFRLRTGRHAGVISLFFSAELTRQLVHDARQAATVPAEVVIAAQPISRNELAELAPGDVILSDHPASDALPLLIDGQPAGKGHIGHLGNQRVILLTHIASKP